MAHPGLYVLPMAFPCLRSTIIMHRTKGDSSGAWDQPQHGHTKATEGGVGTRRCQREHETLYKTPAYDRHPPTATTTTTTGGSVNEASFAAKKTKRTNDGFISATAVLKNYVFLQ